MIKNEDVELNLLTWENDHIILSEKCRETAFVEPDLSGYVYMYMPINAWGEDGGREEEGRESPRDRAIFIDVFSQWQGYRKFLLPSSLFLIILNFCLQCTFTLRIIKIIR